MYVLGVYIYLYVYTYFLGVTATAASHLAHQPADQASNLITMMMMTAAAVAAAAAVLLAWQSATCTRRARSLLLRLVAGLM